MPGKFDHLIIKEYDYFTLFLNEDQRYLGRSYAWLKREGEMQLLSQLTIKEMRELHKVICPEFERAVGSLWKFGLMNYLWLGNHIHVHGGHGHMHLIPRYQSKGVPSFKGRRYPDGRWGQIHAPYKQLKLPRRDLITIRDAIQNALSGLEA